VRVSGRGPLTALPRQNFSHWPGAPRWVGEVGGAYHLHVGADRRQWWGVEVRPGEALLLELLTGDRGVTLRRRPYLTSDLVRNLRGYSKVAKPLDGWQLGVLQNQQLPGGRGVTVMPVLEKPEGAVAPRGVVRQVRPEWAMFRVHAAGAKGPAPQMRVTPLWDYPATAWSVALSVWPLDEQTGKPAAATLEAWWWPPGQELPVAARLTKPPSKTPVPWRTEQDGGLVTLEGLGIERCRVEGGDTVQGLVVRLSHPPDQEPVFVQLEKWQGGQEHRFYRQAGKYTAVFYPMTEEEARQQTVLLLSVAAFKKHARTLTTKLPLGAPNSSPRPPRP